MISLAAPMAVGKKGWVSYIGVLDGQSVSQSITNPAFINKNIDDVMPNKLGFSRPLSGPTIADIQKAVNNLYTATGVSESQSGTTYNATPGTIINGDSYQLALTKLADKFDPATGHFHTGSAGDGPLLSVVRTLAASGSSPIFGDLTLVAGTNMSITESATGFTFDATTSVTTTIAASGNPDLSGQVILVAGGGVTLTQIDQQIMISASGGSGGGSGMTPTVQRFLAATGGTYILPSPAPSYLEITLVGGGGGGQGGEGGAGGLGASGGDTTFGTLLLTAGGGGGGGISNKGGVGGTNTINSPAIILFDLDGQNGSDADGAAANAAGKTGGSSLAGGGPESNTTGETGVTNGGGGGAGGAGVTAAAGEGGGGGGVVKAWIMSPSSSYSFSVGSGGGGGSSSGAGSPGGPGADGQIVVKEFYGSGSSNTPVSVIADTPTSSITGSITDITGWTEIEDPTNSFDPTTGIFTVPKTALYGYSIDLYLNFSSATVNNSIISEFWVNGVSIRQGNTRLAAGLNSGQVAQSSTWRLTIGDTVVFKVSSDPSGASFVAGSNPSPNFMSIWEIG